MKLLNYKEVTVMGTLFHEQFLNNCPSVLACQSQINSGKRIHELTVEQNPFQTNKTNTKHLTNDLYMTSSQPTDSPQTVTNNRWIKTYEKGRGRIGGL